MTRPNRGRTAWGAWWHGFIRGHPIVFCVKHKRGEYRCATCDIVDPFWLDWQRYLNERDARWADRVENTNLATEVMKEILKRIGDGW